MKNTLLFLTIILCSAFTYNASTSSNKINWVTLEEAQQLVKTNPKPILVDVYAPWCKPCKKMLSETFTSPKTIKYINKNYYAVKFKAETAHEISFDGKSYDNPNFDKTIGETGFNKQHGLTKHWEIKGYPTIVVLNQNLEVEEKLPGFFEPSVLVKKLKQIDKRVAVR